MITPIAQLGAQLLAQGIRLAPDRTGLAFVGTSPVFRRRYVVHDDSGLSSQVRAVSIVCSDRLAMASAVAGHLAQIGASPLWLWPGPGERSLAHAAAVEAWRSALDACGADGCHSLLPADGSMAVEVHARGVVLPRVIVPLLGLPEARCTWIFTDAPLVTTIVPPFQVWMDSNDPRLLPAIELA